MKEAKFSLGCDSDFEMGVQHQHGIVTKCLEILVLSLGITKSHSLSICASLKQTEGKFVTNVFIFLITFFPLILGPRRNAPKFLSPCSQMQIPLYLVGLTGV